MVYAEPCNDEKHVREDNVNAGQSSWGLDSVFLTIPNGSKPIINDHRKRERHEPKLKTLNFSQNTLRLSELKKVLIYETNSSTQTMSQATMVF